MNRNIGKKTKAGAGQFDADGGKGHFRRNFSLGQKHCQSYQRKRHQPPAGGEKKKNFVPYIEPGS